MTGDKERAGRKEEGERLRQKGVTKSWIRTRTRRLDKDKDKDKTTQNGLA